jgi:hypothetical protein
VIDHFKFVVAPAYERAAGEYAARGQRIPAIIVSHVARRISTISTLEDLAGALREADDLTKWLPLAPEFRDLDPALHKQKVIDSIKEWGLDQKSKEFCMRNLVRPGRPPDTRFAAIEALELHRQGLNWPEIERRLVPHRVHATNSGRSIDREVELLENTLKRYGIRIDPL